METMQTFTDPNAGPYDGADRILHVPFLAGTVFADVAVNLLIYIINIKPLPLTLLILLV